MKLARLLAFLAGAACCLAPVRAQVHELQEQGTTAASVVDLGRERGLLDESAEARKRSDHATARAKVAEAVAALLARVDAERDPSWLKLLQAAGQSAWEAQDVPTAKAAWQRVFEVLSQALPEEHPELNAARHNLGNALYAVGDLALARDLFEKELAVGSRTLPDEHLDLQKARWGLANTLYALGDLAGARTLFEAALAGYSRTLPNEHAHLQGIRTNLAITLRALGELADAKALQEKVIEVYERTLPDEHPNLQAMRLSLAVTLRALDELAGAQALQERVLEIYSCTLPDEHPDLQQARWGLANTLYSFGDLNGARALGEEVLEVYSRTLPDEHPDLQRVRANLASTILALGDSAGARVLEEKVLEVFSRTLPDHDTDLQKARANLANTLFTLGDLPAARALQEKALEVFSRTLPEEHLDLQAMRVNLAGTLSALGDLDGARALEEAVLAIYSRTLPDEHSDLQSARSSLAATLFALGDLAGARVLFEGVLAVYARTLPDEHPALQRTRASVVCTLAGLACTSPAAEGENERSRERCRELLLAKCRAETNAAREAFLTSSPREAQARCAALADGLDLTLSFALGYGVFAPLSDLDHAAFVQSETTRAAALGSASLMRKAAGTPRHGELRASLLQASAELVALGQQGSGSAEFQAAWARRDAIQRELVRLASESGSTAVAELDEGALAAHLGERAALVGVRRYTRSHRKDGTETAAESLCALVLRRGAGQSGTSATELTLVDLGPCEPIEATVRAWRSAIGAGLERGVVAEAGLADVTRAKGLELRRLVLDPLLPALADAERIVIALDDVLHLVPLDALPMDEGTGADLVGDRWRIETRCTLAELLAPAPAPRTGALIALGGAGFNSEPLGPAAEDIVALEESMQGPQVASILRGSAWERGFAPLSCTGLEAREIAALYDEVFGDAALARVLEKRKASRAALEELAPRARFLHVATHGWFASESIRSWKDPEPLDQHTGLGLRLSGEEQVRGMSPMLLCGLALAGANLPEDAVGRPLGLVTAEEMASWDLSGCELAVLSACDTNVGERRAGQGVASLQMALQMAGARSVMTSLWRVPDEATRELMLDFYRRLWAEKKPKSQALWEAKLRLRNAKDVDGRPRYTTRDWAGWMLTGEPR